MNDFVPFLTAFVGAGVGASGSYVALRRDRRETRSQVLDEAKETIDLLKEQNDLLRGQLIAAEEREKEFMRRELGFEKRIGELEREYRNLIKTISSMGSVGLCNDPNNCQAFKNFKP